MAVAALVTVASCTSGGDPTATPTIVPTSRPSGTVTATATAAATVTAAPTATPGAQTAAGWQEVPAPPDRDLYELGRRLKLRTSEPVPRQASPLPAALSEGDVLEWVVNRDSGNVTVNARVWLVTENAYWLFEDAYPPDESRLADAAEQFESVTWPVVTGTFGNIATPGVDGDSRLVIFHGKLRSGVAGYFSGDDQYPEQIKLHSNQREAIYMSADNLLLGSANYLSTLAHELQHASHWAADAGEESWVNEGLSEVAAGLAGYPPGSVDAFLRLPNTSLLEWSPDIFLASPNYGASASFFEYISAHYGGPDTLRAIVDDPADSIAGIEGGLSASGYDVTFVDVFADWVVANYTDDADGKYSHPDRNTPSPFRSTIAAGLSKQGEVRPFGTDYYVATGAADELTLTFEGDPYGRIFPAEPHSGDTCWWSNAGDSVNSTLTRRVDLTGITAATLRYDAWYSIEENWDYVYLTVSLDGGVTWETVPTQHTTTSDPNGASYGPGITGSSGGWVQDSADLAPFAGKEILLSFEYITDDAIHDRGACFDDFSIPELGWSDDTSTAGDWDAAGFLRINDRQPVQYMVQVIRDTPDGNATVERMTVSSAGTGEIVLHDMTGTADDEVVIAVSAVTPEISGALEYSLSLSED